AARQGSHHDVDLVLFDQLARRVDGDLGLRVGGGLDDLDLASRDDAAALFHRELGAAHPVGAAGGERTLQCRQQADLHRLALRAYGARQRCGDRSTDHRANKYSLRCFHFESPLVVEMRLLRMTRERSCAHSPSSPSGENSTMARNTAPMTRLKRSRSITSIANVCNRTKTSAPMNAPSGCFIPPSTAMIRMLISHDVDTDPGVINPLYQTSRMPPAAAIAPASAYAATRCATTLKPSAFIRRGLSRMPCIAMPNGVLTT